jgi:hypothetical protein
MVEEMKFSIGLIVVVIAIVIFYLRIAMLRGQKKRYAREYALKRRKVNGRSKGAALPAAAPGSPPFSVSSWWLVALALLLMLAGIVVYNNMAIFGINLVKDPAFVKLYAQYWYIPVALGVIAFAFCFKIQKPIIDD